MQGVDTVDLPLKKYKSGKVREVFETNGRLLIVSTDRISAFDYVLPSLIPDKGKVLNRIASFWFDYTKEMVPNHVICDRPEDLEEFAPFAEAIAGRTVLTRKLEPYPIEAIVRGYIVGSGWKSYQQNGEISGVTLPPGLRFAQKFPEPIFTPTTKADEGHDEEMTYGHVVDILGQETADAIRDTAIDLFTKVSEYAFKRGIIIADTKFEFGRDGDGHMVLIDEIFTPDSSRFWKVADYQEGREPPAFDKQFVRNFLLSSDWDRNSVPPELPDEIVAKTREKYLEIYQILTGLTL
jgi:phosphoribosylaminoimidazole-succinocarboxamide synthase